MSSHYLIEDIAKLYHGRWGIEELYKISKDYFDSIKIPIIDFTINGKLRVFKRGNIHDILN